MQFSDHKAPKAGQKIVYIDGAFDCFHCGHADMLKKARAEGDYVIAGIFTDKVVNEQYGANYPIMNINERCLGVLQCRYVDEVVMGVPYEVTEQLIKQMSVTVVVSGSAGDSIDAGKCDPYAVPKKAGIHKVIKSENSLTTPKLIERVIKHRMEFEERQRKKLVKDKETLAQNPNLDIQEL